MPQFYVNVLAFCVFGYCFWLKNIFIGICILWQNAVSYNNTYTKFAALQKAVIKCTEQTLAENLELKTLAKL
jgi:hypothetical protein